MTEAELRQRQIKVVCSLAAMGGKLSRAQLTVGPLRHISARLRNRVLKASEQDGLLVETTIPSARGWPTRVYTLTDKGYDFYKQHQPQDTRH